MFLDWVVPLKMKKGSIGYAAVKGQTSFDVLKGGEYFQGKESVIPICVFSSILVECLQVQLNNF